MSTSTVESSPIKRKPRPVETNRLRIAADDYEQAQRQRVAHGEQIRAIVQGRDTAEPGYLKSLGFEDVIRPSKKTGEPEVFKSAADLLLASILKGDVTDHPYPYIARAYKSSYSAERAAHDEMGPLLEMHPAWAWAGQVQGVGATLGAKLLSRLDIDRARNASSFWSYCQLGTVPGQLWKCEACGWQKVFPLTFEVTGKHQKCKALASKVSVYVYNGDGTGSGPRAAQPGKVAGQKSTGDGYAKKVMFLLASQFLKTGSRSYYEGVYRSKHEYLTRERPGWEKGNVHYAALRVVEKLFLSHLFEAWCRAIGRDPGEPYAKVVLGHTGIVGCDEVLEWEGRRGSMKDKCEYMDVA